jgi:putative methyltransferase (TIGR04325 family)
MDKIKSFIKKTYFEFLNTFFAKNNWEGAFNSWQEALNFASGYQENVILEKCKDSTLKVKNGEAVFERDSVIFNSVQYCWPILALLQKIAIENNNKICVLDFGGSLGTSYYQNKTFISSSVDIQWCVVEQPHFVQCGKTYFQDDNLFFFNDIEECLNFHKPDVVLLSCVLQYIEDPFVLIETITNLNINYLIVDRTSVSDLSYDMITVQNVPKEIYDASYPCWLFSKSKFLGYFKTYVLLSEFNSKITEDNIINDTLIRWEGFLFKKKL